jgi:toxin ParE1/3/4
MKYILDVRAEAADDIDEIAKYTEEHWGAEQAIVYVDALEKAFKAIAKLPERGTRHRELPGYLSARCHSHVIYYQINDNRVVVVRVLHKARLPQLHLLDR